MWNVKELPVPPVTTCVSPKKIDVMLLKKTLKEGVEFYGNQRHLASEGAILSRLIYRMKLKFRSSKDFKSVEKLNHALLNYLHLKVPILLRNFDILVPAQYQVNCTPMPSKNLLDYILVRLQGLGKLLWRILESCKIVSQFQRQRLRLGHFWKIALITFGLASRVFVIIKNMIKFTCDLYTNLRPFSTKLCFSGNQWLPQNYKLPESLSEWLDIDWLDLENTIIEIPDDDEADTITSYFNLIESDDEDADVVFSDQYILIKDEGLDGDDSAAYTIGDDSIDDIKEEMKEEDEENDVEMILTGFTEDQDVGEVAKMEIEEESVIFVKETQAEFIPINGNVKKFGNRPKSRRKKYVPPTEANATRSVSFKPEEGSSDNQFTSKKQKKNWRKRGKRQVKEEPHNRKCSTHLKVEKGW